MRNDISRRDQRQDCRRENAERPRLILLLISSVPWPFATNIELYSDDGLIIVDKSTPRKCDGIRKKLYKLFDDFGFRLDVTTDLKITNYLDITLKTAI